MPPRKKKEIDFKAMNAILLARALSLTPATIENWKKEGCPVNEDTTLNLGQVFKWRVSKEKNKSISSKTDVEIERLQLQCKQLQLKINETEGELMPASTLDEILSERARSLSSFLPRSLIENAHAMQHLSAEELKPILREIATRCMEIYTGKGTQNG